MSSEIDAKLLVELRHKVATLESQINKLVKRIGEMEKVTTTKGPKHHPGKTPKHKTKK